MAVVVVTGSDSGIGRATAVALAEDGFDVGVTWHSDEEGAKGTAGKIAERGRRAETRRLDRPTFPPRPTCSTSCATRSAASTCS